MRNWTPEKSLADMDAAGVAVAMLSVTQPGVNFTSGEAARKLARECNEYAARLIADHPGRFGGFAMLPLTDTEGSLKEIAYALDTLKLDGIGLLTSYGDKWLGDPSFLPVMEELNRRKVVVYTHPATADCCVNLVRTEPPGMIECGTDTTRTIADIIFSGNAQKFRDIRWIFSHAGGTMPFLIERFDPSSPAGAESQGDGAGRHAGRTDALLLRHRANREQGRDVGADGGDPDLADRVRHRLSVPDQHRPCEGTEELRRVHRRPAHGHRTRQRAQAAAAARGVGSFRREPKALRARVARRVSAAACSIRALVNAARCRTATVGTTEVVAQGVSVQWRRGGFSWR